MKCTRRPCQIANVAPILQLKSTARHNIGVWLVMDSDTESVDSNKRRRLGCSPTNSDISDLEGAEYDVDRNSASHGRASSASVSSMDDFAVDVSMMDLVSDVQEHCADSRLCSYPSLQNMDQICPTLGRALSPQNAHCVTNALVRQCIASCSAHDFEYESRFVSEHIAYVARRERFLVRSKRFGQS